MSLIYWFIWINSLLRRQLLWFVPAILLLLWIGGPLFGVFVGIVVTLAIGEFLSMTKADKFSLLKWISYAGGIGFCFYFYYLPQIEIQIILLIFGLVTIFVFIVEMFQSNSNPTRNLSDSLFAIIYIGIIAVCNNLLRNCNNLQRLTLKFEQFASFC